MLVEVINFFLSPLFSLFEPYISRVTNAITSQKTQRTAIKTILASGVIIVLISIALIAYFGFYMIYVPKIAHAKPIYLQYQKENTPFAIVDFTENGRYESFLTADQAYDVSIDLDVPSSDRNVALGNFMIGVELIAKNETVQYSSRPCILTYQSGLFRIIYTIWRLIPLLLGFTKEDQRLEIVMFENMIESAEKPITKALITISNSNLDVYSTQIRLDAHFRGLRYFMYYHSVPTAIVFTFMFLIWEILFSIVAWKSFVSWWQSKAHVHISETLKIPNTPGGGDDTNIIDNNHRDDYSDRTFSQRDDRVERHSNDNGTITETESEYESSRPGSVISPGDTVLVSESGEMSYSNTDSFVTDDDDDTHSITRTDDTASIVASETDDAPIDDDDDDDDDYQTEGSATPTSRSRKSTISEASNKSEGGPSIISSATTATRFQSGQSGSTRPTFSRKSGSSVGNNENNME
ncbi:putative adipose-regulatory protein [Glomus cerebriforme]|uniref:Putative adipose-regulatory protein n=1 Tax=Glomus cerebriforme TaxID=658196 RepID=A0A397SDW9_9GLOM|nr:putative adipose-regulatory protein [Glomus cerebriforme]